MDTNYKIQIVIAGHPGFFEYGVQTHDQAMAHFAAITTNGYRRVNDRGQFVWYSPSLILAVKISGEGLETKYPDVFVRT